MGVILLAGITGLKSIARVKVLGGSDQPPLRTGFAAYRATVDVDKIIADPDTAWLLETPGLNVWYACPDDSDSPVD